MGDLSLYPLFVIIGLHETSPPRAVLAACQPGTDWSEMHLLAYRYLGWPKYFVLQSICALYLQDSAGGPDGCRYPAGQCRGDDGCQSWGHFPGEVPETYIED